jgi:SAM-dependent methyltransferase
MMQCPVCNTPSTNFFISTNALMHTANNEVFNFNICNSCETVFLTNPVSLQDLDNYYTENYLPYKGAKAWGKYSSFVERSQKQLDLRRVKFLKNNCNHPQRPLHVLDVGCGDPSFLAAAKAALDCQCTGIDFSDKGWQGKNYIGLNLSKTSIEDFQTSELFDVITLWHYLEHDYQPKKTIEQLYHYLKPGGRIIIEVPNYKSITAKLQKSKWQGWHSPRHISLFSEKSFEMLFQEPKWKIIKHLKYGTLDAFTLWWLGKMEKKGINWSANMEPEFWPLVFLKVISFPVFLFERVFSFGVQILVAEKK